MSSSSSHPSPPLPASQSVPPVDVLGDGGKWGLGKATKLMIAAASGSLRSVEKFIRQGANVNVANEQGFTAMHFAAKSTSDNSDVIHELHRQGLSVNITAKGKFNAAVGTDDGFTPLHLVESAGSTATLIALGADVEAFGNSHDGRDCGMVGFMASANGKTNSLKVMIDNGLRIEPNYCWWAAKFGHVSTVKLMLDLGNLDLGFVKDKQTIAQVAWSSGRRSRILRKRCEEIIKMLNDAGAPDVMPGTTQGPVYGVPMEYHY